MNRNGHDDGHNPKTPAPNKDQSDDDKNVDLLLRDLEETAHYHTLSDLALIAAVLKDEHLVDDPRVYELMLRIYPDWFNEDYQALPKLPRFISIAIPYQVAYDVAHFSECSCSETSDKNTANLTKPCVFCAVRASLFRATHDPAYRPAAAATDDDAADNNKENQ
jgi:hypothetical protein